MHRFRSSCSPGLSALILAATVLALVGAALLFVSPLQVFTKVVFGVVCLGAAVFLSSLLAWTCYDLRSDVLLVRHGFLRWSIPIASIHTVTPVRSLASSAALSRDRLCIRYGDGFAEIHVSPVDRDGFLDELRRLAPGVKVEEDAPAAG